ncbi:Uu.00g017390.m01.CDS01 [Anthostomella pinea]|uniref:Uu.00g017390.m01.CDS01 n=1 Tax=Anthostomella pinea TaxID=933095 RepID=A0AAI8VZS5_9PEZI|nr:Uu.00g017390.m01.CDS01 [Anthostomella pinea]
MAGSRAARLQVGSTPWITEERSSAKQIAQDEVEEFTYSARNDFDWLNEHMAEIFSENQINVAEIFKTPGKLRGKTPRTVRKANAGENRVPLSDIFSATPKGASNPFAMSNVGRPNSPRVRIAADPQPSPAKTRPTIPLKHIGSPKPDASKQPVSVVDSGYHGSQSQDAMDVDDPTALAEPTQPFSPQGNHHVAFHVSPEPHLYGSSARQSPEPTVDTATDDLSTQYFTAHVGAAMSSTKKSVHHESTTPTGSPAQFAESTTSHTPSAEPDVMDTVLEEPSRSPSDGSSPIRPIVRKSSLNFASLPAREPITHKSIGNRISRTSHLDQHRTSYYNRQTGGKSLGNARPELTDDENDENDDMDIDMDEELTTQQAQVPAEPDNATMHNKTYTQRLQDQINKLGQSQANISQASKPIAESTVPQRPAATLPVSQPTPQKKPLPSPKKTTTTPGAFPEDDEDDWIRPLGPPDNSSSLFSPRPGLPKSYSTDVMEGVSGKETVSGHDFAVPKTRQRTSRSKSPRRPRVPEKNTSTLGHHKSVSVPALPITDDRGDEESIAPKKTISVSNPPLATVSEIERPTTPMKTPSRGFGNSPLKQVKNKLSSILKSSKGLLASSAAISAEGKSSLLSPSTTRLGLHAAPSTQTLGSPLSKDTQPLYPDLSRHANDSQTLARPASPARTEGRRTRASIEREKAGEKRKEKEAKEARRMAEQMEKLEKAREKEREKARVFSKEQERVASQEKHVADQKEQDEGAAAPTLNDAPGQTRTSPRKAKPQTAAEARATEAAMLDERTIDDVDMVDAPGSMPPPSVPRSAAPPSATKTREIKRPVRPAKEPAGRGKQAPTVIRVNMGSQHSQYHPSNNSLSSSLHDTLSQPQPKTKPSLQSLKSSTSSVGRPKALEAAARRKEQEEREAQRKRDAKAEMERKRAAMQEEERRQEQQRKLEAERQKEEERRQVAMQAEAKKNAQRQAMLEKAKQTRAPPPAARNQPNAPLEYSRAEAAPARPPSRMNTAAPRSQDEGGRTLLPTGSKAAMKRPLQQDNGEDNASRQTQARVGNAYQSKESKRMRMTDELNDNTEREKQPSLKGAPVRPSGGLKKELPAKSMFPAGYANAPQTGTRDLFKTTLTHQHNSQVKVAHPLDMAQVSKGAIPFAPNPNPAGPSYKTPGRPQGVAAAKSVAKSATRSSPRFQNGDAIELPEINTDDDDDDDDDDDGGKDMVAAWADSPNLRRALVEQETQNPFEVFGAPGPLNMEEVFVKSKDRFHKFRARTSSANWSGSDRLTEEEIRKDLAARDKMRREGGWTYEMSRDMV